MNASYCLIRHLTPDTDLLASPSIWHCRWTLRLPLLFCNCSSCTASGLSWMKLWVKVRPYVRHAYVILSYADLVSHKLTHWYETWTASGYVRVKRLNSMQCSCTNQYTNGLHWRGTIVDLVMGDTRKFFHDCNCIFTYRALFFSITYVQYAYFIPEGDVRSLLALSVSPGHHDWQLVSLTWHLQLTGLCLSVKCWPFCLPNLPECSFKRTAFSALTLLVRSQKGHPQP